MVDQGRPTGRPLSPPTFSLCHFPNWPPHILLLKLWCQFWHLLEQNNQEFPISVPYIMGGAGAPFKCNSVKWRRRRAEPELDWWPWSIVADTPPLEYFNVLDLTPCQHIFTSSFTRKTWIYWIWLLSLFLWLITVKIVKRQIFVCPSDHFNAIF